MTRRRRFVVLMLVAIPVLLCCALAAFLYGAPPSVPDYPNRQQLQTNTEYPKPNTTLITTTFQTSDTPEAVLAYYRQHLGLFRSDWHEVRPGEPPIYGPNVATKEMYVFTYNEEYWFQPEVTLGVSTKQDTASGIVIVTIRLYRYG